jgi:hypothetical protein
MLRGSCHHCMAHLRVATGGDGLQVWRVAANILNMQSRTTDKGRSSSLGVGKGLTTTERRKQAVTKYYTGARNWTDSLE